MGNITTLVVTGGQSYHIIDHLANGSIFSWARAVSDDWLEVVQLTAMPWRVGFCATLHCVI
jgi:hypothetical protein